MRRLAACLLAAATLLACGQQPPAVPAEDEIVVATDFPMSGITAPAARPLVDGAAYPVLHAGSAGRFRIRLVAYDDTLAGVDDQLKGIENVRRLAADPRVLAIVGPYDSSVAMAEIPVASGADLALISPSATNDCLTVGPSCPGPYRRPSPSSFFRLAARDSSQGAAMAELALTQLGVSRVAVLSDQSVYGDRLADVFAERLRSLGGEVSFRERYDPTRADFSDLLTRAARAGVDALYVGATAASDPCRMRSQMAGVLPSSTYFLSEDALIEPGCVAAAGDLADERMIATAAGPAFDGRDPRVTAYLKAHAGPTSVSAYTFAAYDCSLIALAAIRQAIAADGGRKPTRREVVEAVAGIRRLQGVTGTWSFDANGDATEPGMSFYRVESRQWKLWKSGPVDGSLG